MVNDANKSPNIFCNANAIATPPIPKEAAKAVWERGAFEVARIDEIERETRHDVIAFLTNLAEHVGPEARFVHQGMTSSDVLDTCLAVQLSQGKRGVSAIEMATAPIMGFDMSEVKTPFWRA